MKNKNLISIFTLVLLSFQIEARYTMADLEALEKSNNSEEFLLHAMDIRPSERLATWKKMLEHMAAKELDKRLSKKTFTLPDFQFIQSLSTQTYLRNDELIQFKRKIFMQKYVEAKSKEDFASELLLYWSTSDKDPEFAEMVLPIIESSPLKIDTWEFYEAMIKDSASPIYCKKSFVQKKILSHIREKSIEEEFFTQLKNNITNIIPLKCFKELYPPLKEAIHSAETKGIDKEEAFTLLTAFGEMNKEDTELFLALYLLSEPVTGPVMNRSWALIKGLGENFKERERLLKTIEALPSWPAQTFANLDFSRNKAIMAHYSSFFPELLARLEKECQTLLKGTGPSKVSSLTACRPYLNSDQIHSQYSGIKK